MSIKISLFGTSFNHLVSVSSPLTSILSSGTLVLMKEMNDVEFLKFIIPLRDLFVVAHIRDRFLDLGGGEPLIEL